MGEVVNLRLARKRADRRKREAVADSNRVSHGRSKAERETSRLRNEKAEAQLDGHERTED